MVLIENNSYQSSFKIWYLISLDEKYWLRDIYVKRDKEFIGAKFKLCKVTAKVILLLNLVQSFTKLSKLTKHEKHTQKQ